MGKKSVGQKAALAESFIQFQIQVKRKETEEFKNEIRELEAKNRKLIELHDQLRKEYLDHVCLLHKEVTEQEKELEQSEVFSKGQIAEAVRQNLDLADTQQEELADLHRQLTGVQGQVAELQVQRKEYMRSSEHQQQIQNLQSEHVSMQKDLQEMPENMKRSLNAALSEIEKQTSQQIDEKKQFAIERMLIQMDKLSCHEFKENGWLKAQLAIYRNEVSALDTAVRSLEEENLKHLREQFEHRLNQLPISRNLQAAGLEQMDSDRVKQPMQELKSRAVFGSKPFSRCDSAVKAGDETDPRCRSSSPLQNLSILLYGREREPLHLGSLAETLLTVVGQAMTLNILPSDADVSSMSPHLDLSQAQNQPLTTRIIHNTFQ